MKNGISSAKPLTKSWPASCSNCGRNCNYQLTVWFVPSRISSITMNQIKNQVILVRKNTKSKIICKDQFELRARSNLSEIMERERSLLLEGNTQASFKLSPQLSGQWRSASHHSESYQQSEVSWNCTEKWSRSFSEEDLEAQACTKKWLIWTKW